MGQYSFALGFIVIKTIMRRTFQNVGHRFHYPPHFSHHLCWIPERFNKHAQLRAYESSWAIYY